MSRVICELEEAAPLIVSHCLESKCKLCLCCYISIVKFSLSECKVDTSYSGLPSRIRLLNKGQLSAAYVGCQSSADLLEVIAL